MNTIQVYGRLTADAKYEEVNGKGLLKFCIASSRKHKNKDGERSTDFFDVCLWGNIAKVLYDFDMVKGTPVIVFGEMQQRKFTTKDGEKRSSYSIQAANVEVLTKKKDQQVDSGFAQLDEYDLPFN